VQQIQLDLLLQANEAHRYLWCWSLKFTHIYGVEATNASPHYCNCACEHEIITVSQKQRPAVTTEKG